MERRAGRGVTAALAAAIGLVGGLGVAAAVGLPATDDLASTDSRRPFMAAITITTSTTLVTDPLPVVEESSDGLADFQSLKRALDEIWARTPMGCLTVTADDRVVYEANPDIAVAPASVIKVLTASAALEVLGESAVLRTEVRALPVGGDGVIAGDLWLVGGGDPLLGTAPWAEATERTADVTRLETLADRVVAAGVTAVEGEVVGDETRYDGLRYVDSWPHRFLDDGEVGPLSALTVNSGFRTWAHPGVPFDDPPTAAAEIFSRLLVDRGVRVEGGPSSGQAPAEAGELASLDSAPVGQLVQTMLRESDNGAAELLVKEVGLRSEGVGSTAAGARAVVASLRRQRLPVAGATIADGSGLSDNDRVTCRLLTAVVSQADQNLIAGLPLAARDGTLERRFVGTPVAGRLRAKTGSIDGVSSLAGTVQTGDGSTLTFAYVVNGLPRGDSGRELHDALAIALVTSG